MAVIESIVEIPEEIQKLLALKLKLQKEEFALDGLPDGEKTKEKRKRILELRYLIAMNNTELVKLGYRREKEPLSDHLAVLLRMRDIVKDNFGIETAMNFEKAAHKFHDTKINPNFKLLGARENEILENHHKVQTQLRTYRKIIENVRKTKSIIEDKIKTESDYTALKIYTEIFKML